ncbi:hypothetical protein P7F88_18115 [Vibrio hannami]|uniref:hypothetical protein n=1 Tax=Vibrio hannami TaxID=2717094 RepID=UPI00240FE375|nr:hypothetical protein [Vibrio hannami]MDG3087883.1 hypothetical protein [Vibrio hannami]
MSEFSYLKEESSTRLTNNLFVKSNIEQRINEHLVNVASQQVIFCGNASVASQLSSRFNITLVYSGNKARHQIAETYPAISKVYKSDVLDFIFFNAAPNLVISSDTTVNWSHSFQYEKLVKAIERNRYDVTIVEFIDEESSLKLVKQIKSALPKLSVQVKQTTTGSVPCSTVIVERRKLRR